jgi:isocitrate dehydrogenase kinase/phosphatase
VERRERFARIILNGFESYFAEFQNITLAARSRFENADWPGIRDASNERIDLYKNKVVSVLGNVELVAGSELRNKAFWRDARRVYAGLIRGHNNFEIAETFYNSVYNAVFDHGQIRNEYAFVFSSQGDIPLSDTSRVLRYYRVSGSLDDTLRELLEDYSFHLPYEDLERDVQRVGDAFRALLVPRASSSIPTTCASRSCAATFTATRGLTSSGAFCPVRAACRSCCPSRTTRRVASTSTRCWSAPIVCPWYSVLRASYFMVDASIPSQYVLFLKSLMPAKPISEIYSAWVTTSTARPISTARRSGTWRARLDKFIVAPGIKGMVMSVFTLPSYPFVFKVIKDRFTPPKEVTRERSMAKYRLVKRADRAGRMADTQEFTNLAFARDRFSDELMEELRKVAPSLISERGKALIIGHLYVERRMTPLNLYLQDASGR